MKQLFSAILLILAASAQAQSVKSFVMAKPEEAGMSSARLARIDGVVNDYINQQWIPGSVVLVIRNGKIVHEKAYGYSDAEAKIPMKTDNIFRIASQSKAITSLAVMMLWEEGKFFLDDPVSKYIPEFKNPRVLTSFNMRDSSFTAEKAKSEPTIRQLLTHTSGIDYAGIGSQEFKAIYAKAGLVSGIGNNKGTIAEKMKLLGGLPLKHNPGERYTYGLNNDVLGYLVEIWSGMSFDNFLRKRVFEPLGMKDTWFYLPPDRHSRLVTLYEGSSGTYRRATKTVYDGVNPDYPKLEGTYFSGGAGLSSTVEDYAKFLQLFLNKGEFNGTRLLSRKTVELMLTNQTLDPVTEQFGLGFGLETERNDARSVYSIGTFSWGGAYMTSYWADPKEKIVALIFNQMYATSHGDLSERVKTLIYSSITD